MYSSMHMKSTCTYVPACMVIRTYRSVFIDTCHDSCIQSSLTSKWQDAHSILHSSLHHYFHIFMTTCRGRGALIFANPDDTGFQG